LGSDEEDRTDRSSGCGYHLPVYSGYVLTLMLQFFLVVRVIE